MPTPASAGTRDPRPTGSFGSWVKDHKLVAAIVALILVATIGGLAGGFDAEPVDTASPSAGPTEASPSPSPLASVSPTSIPSPTPPPPPAKPKTYSGSGDRIIKIKKPSGKASEPVIATITNTGSDNFAVWTLNRNLKEDDLLVNWIGDYRGTVLMDIDQGQATTRLQIEAGNGSWKVTLKPLADARSFNASTKGRGDDILIYRGSRGVANISYRGEDNFAVWFYGESSDLLVNEIGNYRGQVVFGDGPALIEITGGSGTWSIKVS